MMRIMVATAFVSKGRKLIIGVTVQVPFRSLGIRHEYAQKLLQPYSSVASAICLPSASLIIRRAGGWCRLLFLVIVLKVPP